MPSSIRVLIVDDYALVREAFRSLLEGAESELDIEVVGEASDGLSTIRATMELQPDLVMLDVYMPKVKGTDVVKEIKQRFPGTKVLMLTISEKAETISQALNDGADGYVQKTVLREGLMEAISAVMRGEQYLCPDTRRALQQVRNRKTAAGSSEDPFALSRRQRQVLGMLVEGQTNKQIAAELFLSVKTVEKHRAALKSRLGAESTADLIARAMREGILTS